MISATNLAVEGAAISGGHAYSTYMHHHLANHHLNQLSHHHRSSSTQDRYHHHTRLNPPAPPGSTNLGTAAPSLNLVPAPTTQVPLNLGTSLPISSSTGAPIKVQAIHPGMKQHPNQDQINCLGLRHMHLGSNVEAGDLRSLGGTEALLNGVPHEALFRLHKSGGDFARPVAKRYSNGVPDSPHPQSSTPGPVDLAQPKDSNHNFNHQPKISLKYQNQQHYPQHYETMNHYTNDRRREEPTNHHLNRQIILPRNLSDTSPPIDTKSSYRQMVPTTNFGQHFFNQDLTNFYAKEIYDMRNGGGGFVPPKPPVGYGGHQQQQHLQQQQLQQLELVKQKCVMSTGVGKSFECEQGFKVPSGKEGSLKHRILRPSPPASVAPLSPQSPSFSVTSPTALPTVASGFSRGALIRLADGDVRRVEDMRADDFRRSADVTGDVTLTDVTVVRINVTTSGGESAKDDGGGRVTLTLSFNQHRDRVEFETSQEHPFFVYGQGWASCSPEATMRKYGLKCNRLQVGDICISLTPKDKTTTNPQTPHHVSSKSLQALKTAKPHYPERTTNNKPPAPAASHLNAARQLQMTPAVSYPRQMSKVTSMCQQRPQEMPRSATADSNLYQFSEEPQNLTKHKFLCDKNKERLADDGFANCKKRRWSAPDDTLTSQKMVVKRLKE